MRSEVEAGWPLASAPEPADSDCGRSRWEERTRGPVSGHHDIPRRGSGNAQTDRAGFVVASVTTVTSRWPLQPPTAVVRPPIA
jgi:hypothetical protein